MAVGVISDEAGWVIARVGGVGGGILVMWAPRWPIGGREGKQEVSVVGYHDHRMMAGKVRCFDPERHPPCC